MSRSPAALAPLAAMAVTGADAPLAPPCRPEEEVAEADAGSEHCCSDAGADGAPGPRKDGRQSQCLGAPLPSGSWSCTSPPWPREASLGELQKARDWCEAPLDLYPQPHLRAALARSFKELRGKLLDMASPPVVGRGSIEDLTLPDIRPSVFSTEPHPQFPHITVAERTRMDIMLSQKHVKAAHMKEALAKYVGDGQLTVEKRQGIRSLLEPMRLGAVRVIALLPAKERDQRARLLLVHFLREFELFKSTSALILGEIANILEFRRHEPGEVLFEQGAPVRGMSYLLEGRVVLEAGPYTVSRGLASRAGVTVEQGPGCLLGMNDMKRTLGGNTFETAMCHAWTATCHADDSVEELFIPSFLLLALLEADESRERIKILTEAFPATQGMSVRDLLGDARRPCVYSLFTVMEMEEQEVFYRKRTRPQPDTAMVYFVVAGDVAFVTPDGVTEMCGPGTLFGDEATRGAPYQETAVCIKAGRLVAIAAKDYVEQFGPVPAEAERRRSSGAATLEDIIRLGKRRDIGATEQDGGPLAFAAQAGCSGSANQQAGRTEAAADRRCGQSAKIAKKRQVCETTVRAIAMAEELKRPMKRREDAEALRREEFNAVKSMHSRSARPRAPPAH